MKNHCSKILRVVFFLFALVFFHSKAFAQLTIGTVDAGPYTPGSSIAAVFNINPATCIQQNNVFQMYLSNATGSFAAETLIGTYNGFYGTYVNGMIPMTGIPSGTGYRVRIKSISPLMVSAPSTAFQIKAGAAVQAKLSSSVALSAETFGKCSSNATNLIPLTNESTANSSVTASITNELTGVVDGNLVFSANTQDFLAKQAHYTVFTKAVMPDLTVATRAYLIMTNQVVTAFSTTNNNVVCLPQGTFEFNVVYESPIGGGMQYNFPGNRYVVNWGDGTTDIFSICDIKNLLGKVSHQYTLSSCGKSNSIPERNNAFDVTVNAMNDFCGSVGASVSSYAKVIVRPVNQFTFNPVGCANTPITFTNTSVQGDNPNGNSTTCIPNVLSFNWYVDGVLIQTNKPIDYKFVYSFPRGSHTVRLTSTNPGACDADPYERTICIQDKPKPIFSFAQTTICAPTILKPTDASEVDAVCSTGNTYTWSVTPAVAYAGGTNANSKEPQFNFTTPGTYDVKLSINTATCGSVTSAVQKIVVNAVPTATLSPNVTVCNLADYNFNNTTTGPTKTTFSGTFETLPTTYLWTITGGDYEFVGGTLPNTQYPSIKFKDYAAYTVTVTHTNGCGTVSKTQILTFTPAPEITAGTDQLLCYKEPFVLLAGQIISGAVTGQAWVGGNGIFTPNRNALNATYEPTTAERDLGAVTLILRASTAMAAPCNSIDDEVTINFRPKIVVTTTTPKDICTGTSANYTISSSVPGTTFAWTASGTANAGGFSPTGSGNTISNILTNSDPLNNAQVTYVIIPTANGCIGDPFSLTVNVTPNPIATAAAPNPVICSQQNGLINLNSNLPGTKYTWTTTATAGISGNTSNATPALITSINQTLFNVSALAGTVTYTITPISSNDCPGPPVQVQITVEPPATLPYAGPDKTICSTSTFVLEGNNPTTGTGKWTQSTGFPGITFTDEIQYNTSVNGLVEGRTYIFKWTITGAPSCGRKEDEVSIQITPQSVGGTTAGSTAFCSGVTNSGSISLTAQVGTIIRWEKSTDNGASWQSIISTANPYVYTDVLQTTQFRAIVLSGVCLEAPSTPSTITINPAAVLADAGADQNLCNSSTVTLSGNSPLTNTGNWTLVSAQSGVTIVNPALRNTMVNGLMPGQTYIFKWTISGLAPCGPSSDEVAVKINPLSVGGTTSGNVAFCSGSNNSGIISLSGQTGNIVRWEQSTDGVNWTAIASIANPYAFTNVLTTTQFRAVVMSGNCPEVNSSISTVAINPAVVAANAGTDQVLCNTSSVTLDGNSPLSNTGTWTIISAQSGVLIANPSLPNTSVSGLQPGETYIFRWTISGLAPCGPSSDDVTFKINPLSNGGTTAGNVSFCSGSNNSGIISLSGQVGNIIRWEKSTDNGVNWISIASTANPYPYSNVLSTTQFRAVVVSGNCAEANSTVSTVTINQALAQAIAGTDQVLCNSATAVLNGNAPASPNTGVWTLISGQTGVNFNDATLFNTAVQGLVAGQTYTFKWTISGQAPCAPTSDVVEIKINPSSLGGITSGGVFVCSGSSNRGTISLSGQVGNVVRWETSINNGSTWIPTATTDNFFIFNNVAVTTQYRAVVVSGNCPESKSTISTVTVNPLTVGAAAGPAQNLCSGNSIQLNGNDAAPNTGTWTIISGQTGLTFQDKNLHNTLVTGLVPGQTYTFRWTIAGLAPCPDTFSETTVTYFEPVTNAISASALPICFGQSTTIQGDTPTGGLGNYSYQWQKSDDGANWADVADGGNKNLTISLNATTFFRRLVNSNICTSISNTLKIIVLPKLDNNLISDNQTVCAGTVVQELKGSQPTGGNGTYVYQWQNSTDNGQNWIDINGATGTNFLPPIPVNPVFYRRMVSSGPCSGSTSNEVKIIFSLPAKAEIAYTQDKGCTPFELSPNVIKATDYTDRNGTYTWYADNIEIGKGPIFPGYTLTGSNKNVEIKLVVTSLLGCAGDEIKHTFSTYENVTAAYKQDAIEGCGPLNVLFVNTSNSLTAATFKWDFGNGITSNVANPDAVTFLADPSGKDVTYEVKLEATTPCGTTVQTSTVRIKGNPVSIFAPDKTTGCSPFTVTFTNNSPGETNTFYYDFGDGNTLTTTDKNSVSHTYTTLKVQDFVVKMISKNDCGSNESQYSIRVSPNDIVPALVVNSSEQSGCAPLKVNFYNNTKGANNFIYDFGDGNKALTNSAPEVMAHTFTKPGTYTVILYASNSCSKATATQTIVVLDQPSVNFTASRTAGCSGIQVKFKNTSSNAVSYLWDFGDGGTSTEFEPQHTFTGTGNTYNISLTATNSAGCSNSFSIQDYIKIVPPPEAIFVVGPGNQQLVPNYTFSFRDMSKGVEGGTWEWDFGDGNRSTKQFPTNTYNEAGSYQVSLKVTNREGCTESTFQMVRVIDVAGTLNVPNAFMPASAKNDVKIFKPKGVGMEEWHMMIFNKWGQLLWESKKLEDGSPAEGWDGTYQGQDQPQGTYFWKIDVKFINKASWKGMSYSSATPKKTGVIYLIR